MAKNKNSIVEVLKYYGEPVNRDPYLRLAYAGKPPATLDPENEAELPQVITPSDLRAEAQRLVSEGKMPSLDRLLTVVAEARQKYWAALKAARKLGTDDETQI